MYEEGNLPNQNSIGCTVISDFCINIEHLLSGTSLSFQLKKVMKGKNIEVGMVK